MQLSISGSVTQDSPHLVRLRHPSFTVGDTVLVTVVWTSEIIHQRQKAFVPYNFAGSESSNKIA